MTDYFDNYFFTSNATGYECPNISFECQPVNACARDPNTGQRYCCDWENDICWTGSSKCATDGSTVDCGGGSTTWCCLDKTEVCTQADGQVNICWNSVASTLVNISSSELNRTYSSLSSASPSANSWAFTPSVLIAETRTTSTTTTTSSKPTTSSSTTTSSNSPSTTSGGSSAATEAPSTATASPASAVHSSASLSGGAIAGIVIGGVALIVLLAAGLFYLLKQRSKRDDAPIQGAAMFEALQKTEPPYQAPYLGPPSELQGHMQDPSPHELLAPGSIARERYA